MVQAMLTRVLTAFIGIPLALVLVWWPGGHPFSAAGVFLSLLATYELTRLLKGRAGLMAWLAPLLPLLAWILSAIHPKWWPTAEWVSALFGVALVATFANVVVTASRKGIPPIERFRRSLFVLAYAGALYAFVVLIRMLDHPSWPEPNSYGQNIMFILLAAVWAGDSGAYFIGRRFGRRTLAPTISPAKTVEGAIANLLFSMLIPTAVGSWLGIMPLLAIGIGAVVGLAGQVGDLFESVLKRSSGAKDSGALLPGHGGVLDRFDSLTFSAPLVYLLAVLAQ